MFQLSDTKHCQALVSNHHDRAAPKGLGAVKAAGNYAADIAPVHQAHGEGYNTTLYLDAKERKFIEEFSVCNFVGITKAGNFWWKTCGTFVGIYVTQIPTFLVADCFAACCSL